MPEIVMPRLSDSMEEGTILTWLKQVGDEVAGGDELVEIETDKANMAYESDVAGTLTEILAPEGETLAIGSPIAIVGDAGEAPARAEEAPAPTPEPAPEPDESVREDPVPEPEAPTASDGERVKASPLARRIARDSGIDLAGLKGSGPGGRIVKADVETAGAGSSGASLEAAEGPSSSTPPIAIKGVDEEGTTGAAQETAKGRTTVVEPSRLQQVVARRMAESKATAPHF